MDSVESGFGGGSELAMISLAHALASRGHDVVVYGAIRRPRAIAGVRYKPAESINGASVDVLVVFRFPFEARVNVSSRLSVFWTTDEPTRDVPYRTDRALAECDMALAISEYHAARLLHFAQACGLDLEGRIRVGGCGVDLERYRPRRPKIEGRFIYCSVPDRGLLLLLHMWPAIRRALPKATLTITGGYSLWGRPELNPPAELLSQPGVRHLGVLSRSQLVKAQLESRVHLHPCPFPENLCLASLECQAAGTPSIVSDRGALSTTVIDGDTGIVVPGDPHDDVVQRQFVGAAVRLMSETESLQRMSGSARRRVELEFALPLVASRWETDITSLLSNDVNLAAGVAPPRPIA